jgi:hypothetical protein
LLSILDDSFISQLTWPLASFIKTLPLEAMLEASVIFLSFSRLSVNNASPLLSFRII